MKFLVISDTHGKIDMAAELLKEYKDFDYVIHLGDYYKDALRLENMSKIPFISLKGNMDVGRSNDYYKILDTEFGKVYLSHGHIECVKYDTMNIMYSATSLGCRAILYGHTHIPHYECIGGIHLLNPGSLSIPRGRRACSYAIVETKPDVFDAKICYLDGNNTKQHKSGFLNKILEY
ncbi:MAG: metallophosphoesterase [Clostridiales bacterium]|nr:metallophosphoesterase [Clostridiales bacterium]